MSFTIRNKFSLLHSIHLLLLEIKWRNIFTSRIFTTKIVTTRSFAARIFATRNFTTRISITRIFTPKSKIDPEKVILRTVLLTVKNPKN